MPRKAWIEKWQTRVNAVYGAIIERRIFKKNAVLPARVVIDNLESGISLLLFGFQIIHQSFFPAGFSIENRDMPSAVTN